MTNNKDIQILSCRNVYEGESGLKTYNLRYRRYDGNWSLPIESNVVERKNAVGVVLYDPILDEVVLVEQFRAGALGSEGSPWLLEIVAGIINDGEKPEEVACQEALEETGVGVLDLIPIFNYWSNPCQTTEKIYLYCGKVDLNNTFPHNKNFGKACEVEDILVCVKTLEQAYRDVGDGVINNSLSMLALQWLYINKNTVKQKWRN